MTQEFVTLPREVVTQALDALEGCRVEYDYHGNPVDASDQDVINARTVLRAALEQPQGEQEPVAWISPSALEWSTRESEKVVKLTRKAQPEYDFTEPLYTHPQPHANDKPMAEIWWDDSKNCDWQLKMLVEPSVARGVRIPLYAGDYETMSVMYINQDGSFTVKAPNEEIE